MKSVTQLVALDAIPWPLAVALLLLHSCVSVRPVYKDKEQAIAEKAVSRFHELHNSQDINGIYDLMEQSVREKEPKSKTIDMIKKTIESVGGVQNAKLLQASVLPNANPGYTSRVSLSYTTHFERGEATEFFTWDIKSGEAYLFEYRIVPGRQ